VSDVLDGLLAGLSIEVTTSITPTWTADLTGAASGPPSAVAVWLKPQIRIMRNGILLKEVAPHGIPHPPNYWAILFATAWAAAAFVLWRKRK
jgi:hypothetical protein